MFKKLQNIQAFQRDQEKISAIDEVDIRNLELEIQKASLEQHVSYNYFLPF